MIRHGYYDFNVWYSIFFQGDVFNVHDAILMQYYGILIKHMSVEGNVYIWDVNKANGDYYVYTIDNIDYYVPNVGFTNDRQ